MSRPSPIEAGALCLLCLWAFAVIGPLPPLERGLIAAGFPLAYGILVVRRVIPVVTFVPKPRRPDRHHDVEQ